MRNQKRNIRPWIVMICIGLISATCLGSSMVLMGSFLSPLSQSLHTKISTLSYYYTILVLTMTVMTPMVPSILERLNNKILYLFSSVAVALSLIVIPHFDNIWLFFLIAIVIGIAISFMSFTPVGILLDNWFVEKSGFAIGLCWAITSVFQGIMSPILSILINRIGWQQSLTILGVIVVCLSVPCALFGVNFSPKQEGRQPYGVPNTVNEEKTVKESVSNHELFMSITFWLLLVIVILLQFPAVLNQMFPTYAISARFNSAVGGFMVTSAMIFDIFLNPLIGSTCDKYGAEKASIVWLAISVISYFLLI